MRIQRVSSTPISSDVHRGSASAVRSPERELPALILDDGKRAVPGPAIGSAAFEETLDRIVGQKAVAVDQVDVRVDGEEIVQGILSVAGKAKTRLDVQFMDFRGDEVGRRVGQALIAAAQRGVQVRLLVDAVHHRYLDKAPEGSSEPTLLQELQAAGVEVRPSNTFGMLSDALERDHRKMVAADGAEALVTGFQPNNHNYDWHDVALQVKGAAITQRLHHSFERNWLDTGGAPSVVPVPEAPSGSGAAGAARVVTTNPAAGTAKRIQRTTIAAIDSARHHVYIENAFFTDREVFRACVRAARRGVDVRIVFSRDNHHPIAAAAAELSYPEMIRAGVKIYELPGMLHTKALSVDSEFAMVGSGNLMPLLEQSQKELNLQLSGGAVRALEKRLFEADFARAELLTRRDLFDPRKVFPLPIAFGAKLADVIVSVSEEAKQKFKATFFPRPHG